MANYLQDYKKLVEANDVDQAPSIVLALNKIDSTKEVAKRKPLLEAALAAIVKWDEQEATNLKKVSDKKEKDQRTQVVTGVGQIKQQLQNELTPPKAGGPPPPPPPNLGKAPVKYSDREKDGAVGPWKKTTFSGDYKEVQANEFRGAIAVVAAFWHLDRATDGAQGKVLAAKAHAALVKELADLDEAVKTADKDFKSEISKYGFGLRKLLPLLDPLKNWKAG